MYKEIKAATRSDAYQKTRIALWYATVDATGEALDPEPLSMHEGATLRRAWHSVIDVIEDITGQPVLNSIYEALGS